MIGNQRYMIEELNYLITSDLLKARVGVLAIDNDLGERFVQGIL